MAWTQLQLDFSEGASDAKLVSCAPEELDVELFSSKMARVKLTVTMKYPDAMKLHRELTASHPYMNSSVSYRGLIG
jgi:hypothetical protein